MVQSGKGPPSRGIRVLMLGHESQRVKSPRPSFFAVSPCQQCLSTLALSCTATFSGFGAWEPRLKQDGLLDELPSRISKTAWGRIGAFCGALWMRLLLAPMEGLADDVLRDILTRIGGYDWGVTEFVRVSGTLLPARAFRRICPELERSSRTAAGTPVRVQLLGSDPSCLADNAGRLSELGPAGIDLNFGCPAPTVNRHRGGAALLDEPELLHAITQAVRRAVSAEIPVTAKMRLGVRDTALTLDCARALADGGAEGLVVHARTKADGYRPPAHWTWIGRVAEAVAIPVVANGEVWSEADWRRCRAESGVTDVMLGRGAVADPFLASRIRHGLPDSGRDPGAEWRCLESSVLDFWQQVGRKVAARHAPGRLKQWVNLLRRCYPGAQALWTQLRDARTAPDVSRILAVSLVDPAARLAA